MRANPQDDAVQTLMLPFESGLLEWPEAGGALFLRARDGWPLHRRALPGLVCEQSFRPEAEALERSGLQVQTEADAAGHRYPLVMLLPPRQRDESRALFARAVAACAPGGRVLACVPNSEGARSAEDDLRRLVGKVAVHSKHKCRVFWSAPLEDPAGHALVDPALANEWAALDAVRSVAGGRFLSRPGVFAWDRIDAASALLVEHLPADLSGAVADLGAGFGYLSVELLARCPGVTALDLYEAEARALDLARRNLDGARVPAGFHWHDVTAGLSKEYDVIVMNPPFHAQGRGDRPDIGCRFIQVAADALRPGGRLWMVANRHLPYEDVLDAAFGEVRVHAQQGGFKVVEAVKAVKARAGRSR
ncbi:class I SAM-dependent methyltransferase [Marilutibacter alkalisoli]|uniref:Class I SAM-dependent methyltransferase n=1 Tax=Marilutibacter alkalisoli TaxID=2591633 RepID=A0A514BNN4_9GAMM|nr:class I SAM-dependent methyltransferase [Lysobacter alkalisoli]QDH68996.1 class I SAM-dependent methyltransferase [Lysobacter alkalisoli]